MERYCHNCGTPVEHDEATCPRCDQVVITETSTHDEHSAEATRAFVISLIAIAAFFIPIIGLVLGIVGLALAMPIKDRPFAKEAILFGAMAVFFSVFFFTYALISGGVAMTP